MPKLLLIWYLLRILVFVGVFIALVFQADVRNDKMGIWYVVLALAGFFGILSLISTFGVVSCKGAYKKFELSEELYGYTKSVGDSLNEYKRLLDQLQAKFTLP